ncbi:MAG: L-rhamnose/proton symporter RhaT [Odoribacteraceae bacterium]|jgi:L-rhamnose-H+ transport protein|nr:L-rhamnose/proton symporter RhaT [Odoribacteraceae bacterium]
MDAGIITGLLIIAVGSFGQSSSYVPIRKVRAWSWESFWLAQGVFAWVLFPLAGALLVIPAGSSLGALLRGMNYWGPLLYGIAWGVGGLTFGLSMRYLGVALGQSIALGTCAAFGTLLPAIFAGADLLRGEGLALLIGVCITLAGIAVVGYAGVLRSKGLSKEERQAAIKDFALTRGLLVALLAGVMSACFALGLDAGSGIKERALAIGVNALYAGLPVVQLVALGGFITNAVYCLFCNARHRTFSDYASPPAATLANNLLFCALAGLLWYSQFLGLEAGKSFLGESPLLLAFSWCILMSLNILFSYFWGLVLKEWKGARAGTIIALVIGLLILISSLVFTAMTNNAANS